MNYEKRKENREKATEAAKNLIDILRPASFNLDEMIKESKQNYIDSLNRWNEAHEANDKRAKDLASKSCDIWESAQEKYQTELETIEDVIRFAKRLIPGKQY